ncbi:hypothetical protein EJB05_21415, partial [Eragrostis curvula]
MVEAGSVHFRKRLNFEAMSSVKKANVTPTFAVTSDRISSLPLELKGKILSKLNVEEAVRASVLSSAWRNVWTIMPRMCLNERSFVSPDAPASAFSRFPLSGQSKFITLVDLALSLHKGSLDSFTIWGKQNYNDVFPRWMYMLSAKRPRFIIIELISGPKHKIPSNIFSISELKYLCLRNCIINLPKDFEGFKHLACLNLTYFSSTDSSINRLISSCSLLHKLHLKFFEGIKYLNIHAEELQFLEVEGKFEEVLLHAPKLVRVHLILTKTKSHRSVPVEGDRKSYLKQAFGSLARIKELNISGPFLTSCPRDEAYSRERIWDQDQTEIEKPTLDHLKTVTLDGFCGLACEVSLVELLLSWAPALEEMKIHVDGESCLCNPITKLLALPRTSAKAKIILTRI